MIHTLMLPFMMFFHALQVFAYKNGPRPKNVTCHKAAHIGMSVAMPAEGPVLPVIWTFAGQRLTRNRIADTTNAKCNVTDNGWADDTTMILILQEIKAYKEREGLDKILLVVDNAKMHYSFSALVFAAKHKISIWGLIPQTTGWTQPLDVGLFGPLSLAVKALAGDFLNEFNLPKFTEMALQQMTTKAEDDGKFLGTSGFKKSGLYPFNRSAIPDKAFSAADKLYGTSVTHPAVQKAAAMTAAEMGFTLEKALKELQPETLARLEKAAEREVEAGKINPLRNLYTAEDTAVMLVEKDEAKRKDEEDKAARKVVAAAKKEEREQAKEAAKLAREAKASAKAAAAAVKVPKAPAPAAPKKAVLKPRKRTSADAGIPSVHEKGQSAQKRAQRRLAKDAAAAAGGEEGENTG